MENTKIVPNKISCAPTTVLNKDSEYSFKSKDIANEFNKYVASIGNELGSKLRNIIM